jgi:hypothetical protein
MQVADNGFGRASVRLCIKPYNLCARLGYATQAEEKVCHESRSIHQHAVPGGL